MKTIRNIILGIILFYALVFAIAHFGEQAMLKKTNGQCTTPATCPCDIYFTAGCEKNLDVYKKID